MFDKLIDKALPTLVGLFARAPAEPERAGPEHAPSPLVAATAEPARAPEAITPPEGVTASEPPPPLEAVKPVEPPQASTLPSEPAPTPVATATAAAESAAEGLARLRATWTEVLDRAEAKLAAGDLGLMFWGGSHSRVPVLDAAQAQGRWYFIGDLHSDYLAWHTLLGRITQDPDWRLCFLGDLLDRGPHHIECFAAILDAAEKYPGRVLWILGNHDDAISRNPRSGEGEARYVSKVSPSEFVDWLNAPPPGVSHDRTDRVLALMNDICRGLPRATLFPDGLLATHGGIPLQDRWASLVTLESFNEPRVLEDFTWTRAAEVPLRRGWQFAPERRQRSSDFDYGYRDLEGFAKAVEAIFPMRRVVRGHDHVEGGHNRPQGYSAVPVLTLNGFGFDYLSNSTAKYRDTLALGVAVPDDLPKVELVPVPADQYRCVYQEQTA